MAAEPAPNPATISGHEILAAYINDALNNGDIIPAREADRIVEEMSRLYPQAWAQYVSVEARKLVYHALRSALESRRQRARHAALPSMFAEAAASGETPRLGVFKLWRCRVNSENIQRCIGDMNRADHEFVAADYHGQQAEALRLESLHRVLARKCGATKVTSEVISEEGLVRLYDELST